MNKKQLFSVMSFLLFFANFFAQSTDKEPLQISPYAGISLPQGDIKNFSQNGSAFGVDATYQFSKTFGLAADINFTSLKFDETFNIGGLPSSYLQNNIVNDKWRKTTFSIGPVFKFPLKKTNISLYALGGISSVKTPEVKGNITGGSLNMLENFRVSEQSSSGFGLNAGMKVGFNLSDKVGFYINPQYSYSGAKVGYSYKDPTSSYIDVGADVPEFSDELYGEEPYTGKEIDFPTFNITAGIKFSFGGNPDKDVEENVNRNLPICIINFDSIECRGPNQIIRLTSTWFGQNATDIIDVKIFNGSTLVSSGNLISNNNRPLGAASGLFPHALSISGYAGSILRAEITINGINGVLACSSPSNDYESPICPIDPCNFQIDPTNFTCDMNFVTFNATSSWTNVLAGTIINISAYQGNTNIPLNISPNNSPFTVSGTGTANHNITISNSYVGQPITIVMRMTDPSTGQVTSCGGLDLTVPPCTTETCDLVEIEGSCRNGQLYMEFSVDWANYTNFTNYSIYLDAVDQNGSPVTGFNAAFPPSVLTAPSGSQPFNMNLMQLYAGQTITITSKICETASNGVKHCCTNVIKIAIPECCENCDSISIIDNTDPNQKGEGFFRSLWTISNITSAPVTKISLVLESFGANNSTTAQVIPQPNFEIQGAGIITPTITHNANPIGSLNGRRSNFWIIDFSPNPFTGGDLVTIIERYDRKILKNYRIRATLYKTDGTRCVQYLYFNN
ncbi:MAG: hypothetical protein COA67_08275 [Lutibacter sp.]|nr:MAG: hypothetical protein COA67_08275 [Lutibacter sp.]